LFTSLEKGRGGVKIIGGEGYRNRQMEREGAEMGMHEK